jgi:hypothetical protein
MYRHTVPCAEIENRMVVELKDGSRVRVKYQNVELVASPVRRL